MKKWFSIYLYHICLYVHTFMYVRSFYEWNIEWILRTYHKRYNVMSKALSVMTVIIVFSTFPDAFSVVWEHCLFRRYLGFYLIRFYFEELFDISFWNGRKCTFKTFRYEFALNSRTFTCSKLIFITVSIAWQMLLAIAF